MVYVLQHIAPDLIYINSFWSVNFSINIIRLKHQGVLTSPVLLAPRGMLGKGARSLKPLKKNFFIAVAKLFGWYQHVVFHATQNLEEKEIRAVFPAAKIKIAGNINALPIMKNSSDKKISHVRLFYLSRIARVKNLHMALQVLKQLPSNLTAEYHIFGNLEDKIYWQECDKIIESLPTNVSVERKGEISFDKIADVISHYHCLFLPTLNENFGHAIVESLLCGCPVIISDQTPWKDLSAHQAGYALNLNAPEAFVSAISHYANLNQADFIKASESAKQYITAKINISATVEHYKTLFHDCIKN
jgi:glycosyltransferase involved in cell wall biosynthesis